MVQVIGRCLDLVGLLYHFILGKAILGSVLDSGSTLRVLALFLVIKYLTN